MLTVIDQGSGPPVLFLHGFSLDGRMWRPQIDALSGEHRCLAPDLPGFGPGGVTEGEFVLAEEITRFLDQRGVDRAHVVGLSLGGAIAVDLALAQPDRVRSLVLVDALLLGRAPGRPVWPKLVGLVKQGRLAEAKALWCEDDAELKQRAPHAYEAMCAMVADYRCGHWAGTVTQRWHTEEVVPRLPGIDRPTLVLVGEHDVPGFHAMADAYAAGIPGARKQVVPGAGHLASMEQPAFVTAALRAFFPA
jgi:pimeloyl-ACP methyl ester carboxylesterase